MSLIAPELGSCYGTVLRDGIPYPCPEGVTWRGILKTTRNGMSWEADACDHHSHKLLDRAPLGSGTREQFAGRHAR